MEVLMRPITLLVAVSMLGLALPAAAAEPTPVALVVCAPGFPGGTAEAQPTIDALVATMSAAAKWGAKDLTGAYFETEKGGMTRLSQSDAALALVPLAFYLEHGDELKLQPRLAAVFKGNPPAQVWTLFAKKGAVTSAASLDGYQIASSTAYSPKFIRGPALGAWGNLPASVTFFQTRSPLSLLRKAALGEKIAVLADEELTASIAGLDFAKELEPVAKSPAMPFGIIATVGTRIPEARWKPMGEALPKLAGTPDGAKALKAVWDLKFLPLDEKGIASAQKTFQAVK
jgi:hypothetical protein